MPKYLFHDSYAIEGVRALIKEGGSSRRSRFMEYIGKLGGKVEAFYYTFGEDDVYTIVDLPDNVSSSAISLALGAGGGFRASTTILLTPEEIDQATQKVTLVGYHPPGQLL